MKQVEDYVVSLDSVTKKYPGAAAAALNPTSLQIHRGEFFSVLGPSGSGKTTLLRLIAGFETTDSGTIVLDGKDVTKVPPYRRAVNTVFQSYALFPHMTVATNVAFPLKMNGQKVSASDARVHKALELVEMSEFAGRYPHQMSGGQRQRVALARAIVNKPSVLLLDEPLGALDLRLRQQMQHVLVELQKELGITFVYVTHDQGEALSMSNRVAVVDKGRIRQLGTPQELYFAPKDEFVSRFIGKSNIFDILVTGSGMNCKGSLGPHEFLIGKNVAVGKARMSVRFESVDISSRKDKKTKALSIDGVVSDMLFLGNVFEVKVVTKMGEIIAFAPATRGSAIASGNEVTVGIDPAEASIFAAGD
jgi:spermidine/putrescine transport system ATP-binding protein